MNITTKTTFCFFKILILTGCFSIQSWGMVGVPYNDEQSNMSETLIGYSSSNNEHTDNLSDTEVFINDNRSAPRLCKKWDIREQISKENPGLSEIVKNFCELLEREDLEFIFDMVWNKCFDHSFKIEQTEVNGIYKGIGIDKNSIFLAKKKGIEKSIDTRERKGYLYSDENKNEKIEVKLADTVLFGVQPTKLLSSDLDEIKKYIKEIMGNPVGYRLILIFLAKCLAQNDKCKKIKLLKVKNKIPNFEYVPGKNLWEYFEFDEGYQNYVDKRASKHKFFVFSSNWLKKYRKVPFMRLNDEDQKEDMGDFTISWEPNHRDIDVLKALIHSQHPKKKAICDRNIKQIMTKTNWSVRFAKEEDSFLLEDGAVGQFVFSDDETLRTMFGITSKGLDFVSLAPYSVDKHEGIEFANIKDKDKYPFKAEQFSQNQNRLTSHNIYLDKNKALFFLHSVFNSGKVNDELLKYLLSKEFKKDFDNRFPCLNVEGLPEIDEPLVKVGSSETFYLFRKAISWFFI